MNDATTAASSGPRSSCRKWPPPSMVVCGCPAAPGTVGFSDISAEVQNPHDSILFHDRNNRSMEELMSDNAKTGLLHNVLVEILRKQYSAMEMALKERVT